MDGIITSDRTTGIGDRTASAVLSARPGVTIDVNDVGRRFQPNDLVVVDPEERFQSRHPCTASALAMSRPGGQCRGASG